MPTYRCTNPKNYKLTSNKTYEVLEDLNHSIKIINDNNKVVNYHKNLFTEVIEEPQPTVAARTEQDVIMSMVVRDDGTIIFTDLQNNEVTIENTLIIYDPVISCGITQIDGINNTIENIENIVDTSDEDLIELKQQIFRLFIENSIRRDDNRRYFLFSTNHNPDYEDYFSVLDAMSQGNFGWEENPNSGNDIKLWILNRNIV